jgi:hypothetical protein
MSVCRDVEEEHVTHTPSKSARAATRTATMPHPALILLPMGLTMAMLALLYALV